MIQIATNTDQSERLKACGVDPKSADMVWQEPIAISHKQRGGKILAFRNPNHQIYVGDVPAWSLSRLISLLPSTITSSLYEDEDPDGGYDVYDFNLFIYPTMTGKVWNVSYSYTDIDEYSDDLYETAQPSLIEAVVKMIETLTSHNRKLNEIKQ